MQSNKTRTRLTLSFILFLAVFSTLIPYGYGNVWSPDTRLTWDIGIDWSASIAQANDGRIWFVWHSSKIGKPNPDILYKVYNGSSTFPWSPTKKLTTDTSKDRTPSITATTDGDLWFVWVSNRDGNFEIYYKTYDGTSWSPDTRLTYDTNIDESPSIMQDSNGDIWVVWSSNRTGNHEILCQIYNGTAWWPETPIFIEDGDPADDLEPTIMEAADGWIWLVWVREDNLFYKTFSKTFFPDIPETQRTFDSELNSHPSIMQAQDGTIWIAWSSNKSESGEQDIYVKKHPLGTPQWGEEQITFDKNFDVAPTIMQAEDGTIWIAWTSDRLEGNFDIYYKTDDPPQHSHDVAIMSVTRNPTATYLAKGSTISIEIIPQNQGLEPEICEVQAYANSTLIGQKNVSLIPGQLMAVGFTWNTSDTAYGVYNITAMVTTVPGETDTADNSVNNMVMVTVPGDINGDRIVDIFDKGAISAHWYPGPPIGPLSYDANCDVNHDDAVDIFDISIASAHWGESS